MLGLLTCPPTWLAWGLFLQETPLPQCDLEELAKGRKGGRTPREAGRWQGQGEEPAPQGFPACGELWLWWEWRLLFCPHGIPGSFPGGGLLLRAENSFQPELSEGTRCPSAHPGRCRGDTQALPAPASRCLWSEALLKIFSHWVGPDKSDLTWELILKATRWVGIDLCVSGFGGGLGEEARPLGL